MKVDKELLAAIMRTCLLASEIAAELEKVGTVADQIRSAKAAYATAQGTYHARIASQQKACKHWLGRPCKVCGAEEKDIGGYDG